MCKFCKFLCWLTLGKRFQTFLLKEHIANCSHCQKEIEEANNRIKEISIVPNWIKEEESLWPQMKQKLYISEKKELKTERKHKFSLFKRWRWATVVLIIIIVMGLGLLIHQNFLKRPAVEEAALVKDKLRIKITFAEIKGKEAKPYVYQTPTKSFIWFAKTKNNGG